MRLSEDLQQCHDSGDFGNALKGYAERAKKLEDEIAEHNDLARAMGAMTVKQMYNDYKQLSETLAKTNRNALNI